MRFVFALALAFVASSGASAADYRGADYYPAPQPYGIRPAPPMYIVAAPPHYVQDARTGRPGRWVVLQPTFWDRLFGDRMGY
jgi:hypothetical protein